MGTVCKPDNEVRAILVDNALKGVVYFKTEMIVLDLSFDTLVTVEFCGFACLPAAVIDTAADV